VIDLISYNLAAVILLLTFWLLIVRLVRGAVNAYAFQSVVLGLVSLAAFFQSGLWHLLVLAITTAAINGVLIPIVLSTPGNGNRLRQAGDRVSRWFPDRLTDRRGT